ncbi:MAG TPA: FkbM family methyltransferase [Spirochaetota bacterium]|nr:MAG: 2-O-methyltransferase NoeI [Spirochaetes bacterium ADurb.Bin133]HNZ27043.1 FkbM family methyltransferase [Spirochaetota bacterium]HPY88281.1 FkbM family methyltransferase [Spirochaetota bacterium]
MKNILKRLKKTIKNIAFKEKGITKKDIIKYLPNNPIILEAGAAEGGDTVEFSELLPDARIYAFEPVSKTFKILAENVKTRPNVTIYNMALSDTVGEAQINISSKIDNRDEAATSSTLLNPKGHLSFHKNIVFDTTETIKTITLDEWAKENKIEKVDFMWLDMQGMEYRVLNSSPEIFKTVKLLYTEVSLKEMFEGAPLYDTFKKWLKDKGFKVVKEEFLWEDMGNVLFIRKK